MLPAAVEILLAADDLAAARAASAELSEIALAFGAPLLAAASAHAAGAVLLADGDIEAASTIAAAGVRDLARAGDAVRRGADLPAVGRRL